MIDSRSESLRYLKTLREAGIRLGLERITALVEAVGNPQNKYPVIQVTGTNGKGSIASTIATVLTRIGMKIGLYTSPHLVEPTERVQINGRQISWQRFFEILSTIREIAAEKDIEPTYFEILTAAAVLYFDQEKVDLAVMEAGLGRRLDATSIAIPRLLIVTEIDLDHTRYLGHSLEEIAIEKLAGIDKQTTTLIGTQKTDLARFMERAVARGGGKGETVLDGCSGRMIDIDLSKQIVEITTPDNFYPDVQMALLGYHQLENLVVATRGLELLKTMGISINDDAYRSGVARVSWPGRFQVWKSDPPIILDGAHNPAGMRTAARTLETIFGKRNGIAVVAPLKDKDIPGILDAIGSSVRKIILAPVEGDRAIDPPTVAHQFKQSQLGLSAVASLREGIVTGLQSLAPAEPLLITGSLVAVGQSLAILDKIPFAGRAGQ